MAVFRIMLYEDDDNWVASFRRRLERALRNTVVELVIEHKRDTNSVTQDLALRIPDLVMVDHDLGEFSGEDVLEAMDDDPAMNAVPIYFFSGGTSLEELREIAKRLGVGVNCYTKIGEELYQDVLNRATR